MSKEFEKLEKIKRFLIENMEELIPKFKESYQESFLEFCYQKTNNKGFIGLKDGGMKNFDLFNEMNMFILISTIRSDLYTKYIQNKEKDLVREFIQKSQPIKLLSYVYNQIKENFDLEQENDCFKKDIKKAIFYYLKSYMENIYKKYVEKLILQNTSPIKVTNLYIDCVFRTDLSDDNNKNNFKKMFIEKLVVTEEQTIAYLLLYLYNIDEWFFSSKEIALFNLFETVKIANNLCKNSGVAEYTYETGYKEGLAESLIDSQSNLYITVQRIIFRLKENDFSNSKTEENILKIVREKIKAVVSSEFEQFSFKYNNYIIRELFLDKVIEINKEQIIKKFLSK